MPTSVTESGATPSPEGLDLVRFLRVLLQRRRLLIILPLAFAVVGAVTSLLLPKYWAASATFLPETKAPLGISSTLAGVASQFGIDLGADQGQSSPRLYEQLAESRSILERLLWTPMPAVDDAPARPLIDWVGPSAGADSAKRETRALRRLRKAINVNVDLETHVVRLTLEARNPRVASVAANDLVEEFSEFNLNQRQTHARERRRFVEQRAAEAKLELDSLEDSVVQFLQQNVLYQQSPELVDRYQRLQRQVQVRQQVYLTLAQERERARIEEVNDTPMLTVIDSATPPTERSRPERTFITVAMFAAGLVVAVLAAFISENLRRRVRRGDADVVALEAEWRAVQSALPKRRTVR